MGEAGKPPPDCFVLISGKRDTIMAFEESYWWYLTIEGPQEQREVLASLAELSGCMGTEENESGPRVSIRAYFRSSHDLGFWMARMTQVLESWPEIELVDSGRIENQKWHKTWKEAFPPLEVGQRFVVLAPWHRGNEPQGRIPLYIYPGSSFGTGYHESTQIVLVLMERHFNSARRIADIGTGSGILSIASLKLGAQRVHARDIDPAVGEEVMNNLKINDLQSPGFSFDTGDLLESFPLDRVDIILANIVVEPLLKMLPHAESYLAPSGSVIMSGMVLKEKARFLEALENTGLAMVDELSMKDWWGVVLCRKD